jgi:O-succinylbenzoic acid--CoA ligase
LISKNQILASAEASLQYFNIDRECGFILCLPAQHVGGFMVLARALVANSHLWILPPKSNPFPFDSGFFADTKWFVSLVPIQLTAFNENDELLQITANWKGILLGGGDVGQSQLEFIQKIQCPVYQSFGMTETVSHIAIRDLKEGRNLPYKILPGISIKANSSGCICIRGAVTNNLWIETRDQVNIISDTEFFHLGRIDDVINSGGIKIHPNEIKNLILNQLVSKTVNFELIGIADEVLGEKQVMIIEGQPPQEISDGAKIDNFFSQLYIEIDKKKLPKKVYSLEKLPRTQSMKIDKPELKRILKLTQPLWGK